MFDRIRMQLEQPDGLTPEAIQPLIEEYSRITLTANERLRECTSLLKRGLRAEAIQRANMKPRLIELAAAIDFPELDEWIEIVKFYNLTPPVLLDRDAAHQLQEAVLDEQPLEDILRQHRRLAIAKAPLGWRLRVLRRLAKLDSKNPIWREDQGQWEVIRLKQIPGELATAKTTASLAKVEELHSELQYPDWVFTPPAELLKHAREAFLELQYLEHVKQLEQIASRLHSSFSERDADEAQVAFSEWESLKAQMTAGPPRELVESVEPAIEWLEAESATRMEFAMHEASCQTLEDAIDRKAKLPDLKQKYLAVLAWNLGIPEILERKYLTQVHLLENAGRRKTVLLYSSIVAGVLTVVGSIASWQIYSSRSRELESAVSSYQQFIQDGKFEEVREEIQKAEKEKKHFANHPRVRELDQQAKNKIGEEENRATEFQQKLEEIKSKDPSELRREDLNPLRALAKLPADDSKIRDLENKISDEEQKKTELALDKLYEKTKPLKQQLESVAGKEANATKLSELRSIRNEFDNQKAELHREFPSEVARLNDKSKSFYAQLDTLEKECIKSVEDVKRRDGKLLALREARSQKAMQDAMRAFADEYRVEKMAQEFEESLRESESWKTLETWSAICGEYGPKVRDTVKPEDLTELKNKIDALPRKFKALGNKDFIDLAASLRESILPFMKVSDQREAALDKLKDWLTRPEAFIGLGTMSQLKDRVKRRRFVKLDANDTEGHFKPNADETRERNIIKDLDFGAVLEPTNFRHDLIAEPKNSFTLFDQFIEKRRPEAKKNWETIFDEFVDLVISRRKLDSHIKKITLLKLIGVFSTDSDLLAKEHMDVVKKWENEIDEVRWFKELEFTVDIAKEDHDLLKAARTNRKKSEEDGRTKLAKRLTFRPTWAGIAYPEGDGYRALFAVGNATLEDASARRKLYILFPGKSDPQFSELIPINVNQQGIIEPVKDRTLRAGLPIYSVVMAAQSETKAGSANGSK